MHSSCTESKRGRTDPLGGQAHDCQCKFSRISALVLRGWSGFSNSFIPRQGLFIMWRPLRLLTNWRIMQSPPSFPIPLRQMGEINPMGLQNIPSGACLLTRLCVMFTALGCCQLFVKCSVARLINGMALQNLQVFREVFNVDWADMVERVVQ